MPELPEVETLKRALTPLVLNKRILELSFLRKNLRFPIPLTKIRKGLLNQTVFKITRRGKYILLHVPDGALLIHLGMSGRFTQETSMKLIEKHTHAVFKFDPMVHEALTSEEANEHEENTIISEFVKGYTINNRVLRPSQVVISKKPSPESEEGSKEESEEYSDKEESPAD